jgi:hypothetical protein
MKSTKDTSPSRRRFLQNMAATLPAAAATVAVPTQVAAAVEQAIDDGKPQSKGYRLTQHIADYYKSAAI